MDVFPRETFSRLCGQAVEAAQPLKGGRNSRVWLLHGQGRQWVGKAYFSHPGDTRDRLGTEFGALRFLRGHGVNLTPAALACDRKANAAIYSFLPGRVPAAGNLEHVRAMAGFARRLWALRDAVVPEDGIGLASEACLCAGEIVDQVRQRLARLRTCDPQSPLAGDLLEFIDQRLAPALDDWEARASRHLADLRRPLARELWTLSPSDFGLHNALDVAGEPLRFVDFEYFGWDDPAKLISDVLLHRGVPLSPRQKDLAVREFTAVFDGAGNFPARVKAYLPLLGLKWCCILCNEFVGDDLQRRRFAAGAKDLGQARAAQLAKARRMLDEDMPDAVGIVETML